MKLVITNQLRDPGKVMNLSVFHFHEEKEKLTLIRLSRGSKDAIKTQITQAFLFYNLTNSTLVQALMTPFFVK